MTDKPVTLKEVAEKAGCSFSAAAKVLNKTKGSTKVSKELSARLRKVADELGYSRNLSASRLSRGTADAIGVIGGDFHEHHSPFWGEIASGINAGVQAMDKDLLLIGASENESMIERAKRYASEKRIDALVVPYLNFRVVIDKFTDFPVPVAMIIALEDIPFPSITIDSDPGYRDAAAHLADLGHTEILWTGSENADGTRGAAYRRPCFEKYAEKHGFNVTDFFFRNSDFPQGLFEQSLIKGAYEQFSQYLEKTGKPEFTAIMSYNELTAIGMMHALREHGLSVPEDISIIGYDDLYRNLVLPTLTTISTNLFEMGKQGAELAFRLSEEEGLFEKMKSESIPVANSFIIGESTGVCPNAEYGMRSAEE